MFTPADVVFYFGYSTISIFSEILAWLLMAIGGLFLSIEVIKKHKQIGR
ncbi:MAG: hypothetical protein HY929_03650 [Euryarchaeota archaeon]|nr:hypothetical protein [Euryarchaeota archaeon]